MPCSANPGLEIPPKGLRVRRFAAMTLIAFTANVIAFTCQAQVVNGSPGLGSAYQGQPVGLRGRTLVAEGLSRVARVQVVGRRLVLANFPPAPPIEVRDRATGRVLKRIGTWGQGEGEFMSAYYLDPVPGAERCWVYDVTRHRLALIDVSDAGLRSRDPVRQWLTLRADAVLTSPTWVGDSIISPGFFYTGRFAVFTSSGRFAHFAGSAPAKAGEPAVVTQTAYQSVMRPDPARQLLAVAALWAGKLEIYRTDGSKVADAAVPEPFEPRYQVVQQGGEPRVVHPDEARNGYADLAAADAIYALYSGRTKGETEATFYPAGRTLQVFDWRGRHLRDYQLDKDAALISFDPGTRELYVFHPSPRFEIAVYVVPKSPGSEPPPDARF